MLQFIKYVVTPFRGMMGIFVCSLSAEPWKHGHGKYSCTYLLFIFLLESYGTCKWKSSCLSEPDDLGGCLLGDSNQSWVPDMCKLLSRRMLVTCFYCQSEQKEEGGGGARWLFWAPERITVPRYMQFQCGYFLSCLKYSSYSASF